MDERHNNLMAYVLDEPEKAAREIARLRDGNPPATSIAVSFLIGLLCGLWFG